MLYGKPKPWYVQNVDVSSIGARDNVVAFSLWKGMIRPDTAPVMVRVAAAVADAYGISVEDLKGRSQCREHVRPRQHAMWLMARYEHLSLPMIGRFFGLHHTTVLHGIKAHERRAGAQMTAEAA